MVPLPQWAQHPHPWKGNKPSTLHVEKNLAQGEPVRLVRFFLGGGKKNVNVPHPLNRWSFDSKMPLVNTKHPAFITVGIKKPPCYIHKPPPSKKEEFSIYFYMFPHLAVIWISGYVVAHTMVCTDPLHLSSTLLLQMSSSVCGGGRFCTFHQATNTCGSTDAVFSWMVR